MNLFDAYIWIQANWKSFGWPLAVLFAFLWWNKGCPEPVPQAVTVAQEAKQDAKSSVRVKIRYRDVEVAGDAITPSWKPLPCPDVTVEADSGTVQDVTQVAQIEPRKAVEAKNHLFLGAGYLGTAYGSVGYGYGPWRVDGKAGLGVYGGGLTWDALAW